MKQLLPLLQKTTSPAPVKRTDPSMKSVSALDTFRIITDGIGMVYES
jgi:hypothetical protein